MNVRTFGDRQNTRGSRRVGWMLAALCMLSMSSQSVRPDEGTDQVNLALGKPYLISPKPSYAKCTDKDDLVQLTDGKKFGCNWLRKSTVGWKNPGTPPSVLIDLGRIEPIDEVRVHTAGGGFAGVFFPARVLVLVSDDRTRFHVVAALDDHDLEQDRWKSTRRVPYVYRAKGLHTRGRYVQITLVANQTYVFLDEAEVIRGEHSASEVRFANENSFGRQDVAGVLAALRRADRVRNDVHVLLSAIQGEDQDGPTPTQKELVDALTALQRRAAATPSYLPQVWRELEAALGGLRGRWLAAKWAKPLVWRQQNPMVQLRPPDVFIGQEAETEGLEIELWQGEYESAALTLVNCSDRDVEVHVTLTPLRHESGLILDSEGTLTLRRAVFVETSGAGLIADALVKLHNGRLPLAAGSAGQLWLTVHNRSLEPGEYHFGISLRPADPTRLRNAEIVQGRIVVHPLRFPDRPTLKTFSWAYVTQFGLERRVLEEVARDLTDHYMNVYVAPATDMPKGRLNDDGSMSIDFRRHDAGVRLFSQADLYLFFWSYTPERIKQLNRWGSWMSPEWKSAMRRFLTQWVAHLRELGVGYERFAMYPFDERLDDEFYELAKFIKEVDPRIRIFANSPGKRSSMEVDRFIEYVETWCLPEQKKTRSNAVRVKLKRRGDREVWRYATRVGSRSLSPLQYYRLQPWRAWSAGDTGCAFWAYAASRKRYRCRDWDDFYCNRGRYSVVYDGYDAPVETSGEVVVPSRRWEAWREGIEDYEYLHTLRARVALCRERGVGADLLAEAERTLSQVAADVLANADDPDRVYAARRRVTAAILTLDEAIRKHDAPN